MTARRLILSSISTVLAAIALSSPPALALKVHAYSSSFGSEGTGEGQFSEPQGVAVSEVGGASGEVYVVDEGNNRVEVFSSTGTFLSQFDGSAAPTGAFSAPQWIAVDNSTNPLDSSAGDVYVTDSRHGVIDKFTANGTYLGQITKGSGGSSLGTLDGVGVDASGLVWAYQESGEIDSFSDKEPSEILSSRNSLAGGTANAGFAVDSKDDLYVVHRSRRIVAKLNSTGEVLAEPGEELGGEGPKTGIAVDLSNNNVYLDNGTSVGGFAADGSAVETFGSEELTGGSGLAVDSASETIYVADRSADVVRVFDAVVVPRVGTGEATDLQTEGSATLNGTVNPEGVPVTSCEFEYGPTASYGGTAECAPSPGSESTAVAVSASLSGLAPEAIYHYRLVAHSANGEARGEDRTFVTIVHPGVTEESFSGVGSTTATVSAQINAGGLPATYHVEYGTSAAYGSSMPGVSVGAPLNAVGVLVQLTGLQPATTYHFRFIATNTLGTTGGADLTFTTARSLGASASLLPDNRAYELVSSSSNNQNVYVPKNGLDPEEDIFLEFPFRASAEGDAVTYVSDPESEGGTGSLGKGLGNQYLAIRGLDGWESSDIQPSGTTQGSRYEYFSSDLSVEIFKTEGVPIAGAVGAAPTGCNDLYSRAVRDAGYSALFTSTQTPGSCGEPFFAGSSVDGSHLLFETEAPLVQGAKEDERYKYNLYDSSGGHVHLVDVLPDGKPEQVPDATLGSPPSPAYVPPDFSNAVSTDGSRVFWTSLESVGLKFGLLVKRSKALYVRENDTQPQSPIGGKGECTVPTDACTVQVDAVQGGSGTSGGGRFWTASRDGSKVFFTDCTRLTADSTAVSTGECVSEEGSNDTKSTGNDLYEYNVNSGKLTDLTVDSNAGDHLGADVQGVVGVNEAGEAGAYVYFVASGALAPGATSRTCTEAYPENELTESERREEENGLLPAHRGCNLYVLHKGEPIRFVVALSAKDNRFGSLTSGAGSLGDWRSSLGNRTAEVTHDGHSLVFRSTLRLTDYDNRGGSQPAVPEVFVYNIDSGISCASCSPTGAPPSEESSYNLGAFLPVSSPQFTYMPRWIADDGSRVFFDTAQPLALQDTNGRQDVYEWERAGTGGCGQSGGCVNLLSGGNSPDESYLVDTSASGDDVFFTNRGRLVPQARNENIALYDARVNGGFPALSEACTGTGCQGVPPAPPIFATPSSVTFSGVGNFPPPARVAVKLRSKPKRCKLGSVKKHGRCVKKVKKFSEHSKKRRKR